MCATSVVATYVPVAPESRRTDGGETFTVDGGGGTTAVEERGKIIFILLVLSAVPTCQFWIQKQLLVLPPCISAKVAVT